MSKQASLFKKSKLEYGGELFKTRKGRSGPRPLDTKNTMHLVLRSSKAKGEWSFREPKNYKKIKALIEKFSTKHAIKIHSYAINYNHIHFHFKLINRYTYKKFIRALTAAIMMAVTKCSRWNKIKEKFWNLRPFTRVVVGFKVFLNIKKYIEINQLEAIYDRKFAELVVKGDPYIDKLLSG